MTVPKLVEEVFRSTKPRTLKSKLMRSIPAETAGFKISAAGDVSEVTLGPPDIKTGL